MAHRFSKGQRVRVRENGQLEDGVKPFRGRVGTVTDNVESGELVFCDVEFGGSWERGYFRETALEAVEA